VSFQGKEGRVGGSAGEVKVGEDRVDEHLLRYRGRTRRAVVLQDPLACGARKAGTHRPLAS
jgi:hypothetical protein